MHLVPVAILAWSVLLPLKAAATFASGQQCPGANTNLLLQTGVKAHATSTSKAPKYFFGVSTGHAGTTSLSNSKAYTGPGKDKIRFEFENLGTTSANWKKWYDANPTAEDQLNKTKNYYKPFVDLLMKDSGVDTYVDLGHHNVMGLLENIPEVFGDDVMFLRIRRSPLQIAFSFASSVDDMCTGAGFRICPLNSSVLLSARQQFEGNIIKCKWTAESWHGLGVRQQAFWFQDEIEARWQKMLQANPHIRYVECDWSKDLSPCFQVVAAVLRIDALEQDGQDGVHMQKHAAHDPNFTNLALEYRHYREYMGYDL